MVRDDGHERRDLPLPVRHKSDLPFSPRSLAGGTGSGTPPPIQDSLPGNIAGQFTGTPSGVILHGTRSGQPYDIKHEYHATLNYVRSGAGGLGWNITVGQGKYCDHIAPESWGWNARGASSRYLAAEFAQAHLGDEISNEQISAFCWWFVNVARVAWPSLPKVFPNHSDLPEGVSDGKSDVEPRGQHSVRDRILAGLEGVP